MTKRINNVIDRFEKALIKLQSGETDPDFLSVLKNGIDYSVRLYLDIGRLQLQQKLEIKYNKAVDVLQLLGGNDVKPEVPGQTTTLPQ